MLGEHGDLVPPAEPAVGEAVEEEDEGFILRAGFDVVEFDTLKFKKDEDIGH